MRFLHTSRGFLNDPPGLYAAETVTQLASRWPQIDMTYVPDVNHYTIVMSRRGAAAIAATVPHSIQTNRSRTQASPARRRIRPVAPETLDRLADRPASL